jgi:hypothetical protein
LDKLSFLVVEATSGVKGMLADGSLKNAIGATKNTYCQFMCSHMSKRTVGKVIRPNRLLVFVEPTFDYIRTTLGKRRGAEGCPQETRSIMGRVKES